MGAMQRRKGATGERELIALLREHLGEELTRNLDQARDGGADLKGGMLLAGSGLIHFAGMAHTFLPKTSSRDVPSRVPVVHS